MPNLILISANAEDQAFARAVAEVNQLTVEIATTPDEVRRCLTGSPAVVVLFDASDEETYRRFEPCLATIRPNAIHFLCSSSLEETQFILKSPIFGSFVQRNFGDPVAAGHHYGRVIAATLADRAFGAARFLKDGSKIETIEVRKSSEKLKVVDVIRDKLCELGVSERMATIVASAADEILMNAIFDAPIDGAGKPKLETVPRDTDFPVDPTVQLEMGHDDHYITVTAIDHFGSLDKDRLLNRISRVYKEEEYSVDTSSEGAGIGLATIFRSGGSFLFSSEKSVRTEVTVFFKKTSSMREFKGQFRFISTQFYRGNP